MKTISLHSCDLGVPLSIELPSTQRPVHDQLFGKGRAMRLLVTTPVRHIDGLMEKLASRFDVTYLPDPAVPDIMPHLAEMEGIFTNPNKARFRISKELIAAAPLLRQIVTASTGMVHIDREFAGQRGINVISLTREYETIERISSTAELALTLTLASLRHLPQALDDVLAGHWDYEKFVGRQVNCLKVGVVGYGRLGRKYSHYLHAMGASIFVADPYKTKAECPFPLVDFPHLLRHCDVVAFHVHVTDETRGMLNAEALKGAKADVLIVNTSRGELIDEMAMRDFLQQHPRASLAVDVLADEIERKWESPLLDLARLRQQVMISPHIGGMCKEAQEIAYHRVADLLIDAERDRINMSARGQI